MKYNFYNNFSIFLKTISRFLERVVVIFLRTDLYLLEFFGRKNTYVFFLFAFFFGTFNDSENLSNVMILFRFFCLCFSWYLAFTSILVFIIFNNSLTKQYFYKLLGYDYVKSKIGKKGSIPLGKFAAPFVAGLLVNEGGKYVHNTQNVALADQTLDTQTDRINKNPHLTPEQKSEYTQKALDNHSERCSRQSKGPIVDIIKWETVRETAKPAVETFKEGAKSVSSWWKK